MKLLIKKLYYQFKFKLKRFHKIEGGKNSIIYPSVTIEFIRNFKIGNFVRIGHHCLINAEGGVEIQDGTILAPRVTILSSSHSINGDTVPFDKKDKLKKVLIGKGVWICQSSIIYPGVELGDGCVVAMGSVVTKSFPPNSLLGGNPATLIKEMPNNRISLINEEQFFIKDLFETGGIRENRSIDPRIFRV